ncbi:MAG: hypothetical protein A2Y14_04020 [Verrucomicrobia bacterium GWF2_51_19]|nr:MAG: hypothetical protein A2Y14_04020 [Verrucomicrobia bacterium GWF2_51_19]HCJ11672.1 hypothetical protein [Opitutae bacterium]
MNVQEVIECVAKAFGFEPPEVNERGTVFCFEEGLEVRVYSFKGYIVFSGKIGEQITPDNTALIRQLLQRNCDQTDPFFDILSIDKEEKQVYLSRNIKEIDLKVEMVQDVMQTFLTKLDAWNEALEAMAHG